MSSDTGIDELLALVGDRVEFLGALRDGPLFKRDLIDRLDTSRSTVDRAIEALLDAGLVSKVDGGYRTTRTGRLALSRYETLRSDIQGVLDASPVVDAIPADARLSPLPVAKSTVHQVDPHEVPDLLRDALTGSTSVAAALPGLSDSVVLDTYCEHAGPETTTRLVLAPALADALGERLPAQSRRLATADVRVFRGDVPKVGIVVCRGDTDCALILAYTGFGGVAGALELTDPQAISRLANRVEDRIADATECTEDLAAVEPTPEVTAPATGDVLPVDLESEGVVRLTDALLDRRGTASLLQAWRTGISLADADSGFLIDRASADGAASVTADARRRLRAGEDVVLTGPPGSGKSTVCKRIAVSWHRADHGTVLYRQPDGHRPLESVPALLRAIDATAGHTLVVVEDVVDPNARRALDLRAEFAGRTDVSFLFDARTAAWERAETPAEPGPTELSMPGLSVADCEALLARAAESRESALPLSATALHESVTGDDAAGAFVVAAHRVARLADPLAVAAGDTPTSLSESAADAFDRLQSRGRLAVDLGIWINLLNLADLPIRSATVDPLGDTAFLEDALSVLDGEVLFGRRMDPLRVGATVHDAWSTAFLAHAVERLGERGAQEALGRSLTAVLDGGAQAAAAESPLPDTDDWPESFVAALFDALRTRPRLAGLVGSRLRNRMPESVATLRRHRWHGRLALNAGSPAEASAAFDRLLEAARAAENPHATARARRGLGSAALQQSAYDDAVEELAAALGLGLRLDDGETVVRALIDLGTVAQRRGDHETAVERYDAAHRRATAVDDDLLLAVCRQNLGTAAAERADYDAAVAHARAARETFEAADEPLRVANCLANAANAMVNLGQYEAAAGRYERAIDIQSERGDDHGAAATLTSLGDLERRRGNDERALSYLERAESLFHRIGDDHRLAICLNNIGIVRKDLREVEAAVDTHREALAIREAIGNPHEIGMSEHNLAVCALQRGDVERAETLARESMEHLSAAGNQRSVGVTRSLLADVLVERGEYDDAIDQLETGIEELRDCGADPQADTLTSELTALYLEVGDTEAAQALARTAHGRARGETDVVAADD
ncbi:tetratricopeptide repeat protein [Halolamina salifodinae]|uniref:Tetratricopeptide (TPR) repeat protein/energy-coupling factor transporter ATP-binding protein EcfA2/DNA-binding transcriptional ArsR family regulator n=1 Tax=Halolamina salifodinae TaxID=1202767 RepID=A0A8T4GTJ3_9EURY|nr:tetratricopeptide repeat protein [Halolamina salifodinae]MBP1985720.1 tetratricopeptide (TPR) repeat protein/energy-coupling factor transporter ATP-binding protein EcfA2/DNA-binding transcriptional ArsR family regulator [Halolamina salifodinae]